MARCLTLARKAEGRTSPNPMVGAVIVRQGEVVGEGWHARAGTPHAEVRALREAGDRARGATLYVNLEPCCHHGRTPPCVDAIAAAGIRRLVAGMRDPHPLVDGRGFACLRAAGVAVEVGVLEAECRKLNQAFLTAVLLERPLVVLKAAASLDGRIATSTGESRWITGEASRRRVHEIRNRLDAVLVGRKTAVADDPRLDSRLPGGRPPLPVLLDSGLAVPPQARMFHGERRAVVYTARPPETAADEGGGASPADRVTVPRSGRGLDLGAVLRDLASRGVHSLLVEGGGEVHRSFIDEGVVDRVLLFLAPRVLAGGPGWVGGAGYPYLGRVPRFRLTALEALGQDALLTLESETPSSVLRPRGEHAPSPSAQGPEPSP